MIPIYQVWTTYTPADEDNHFRIVHFVSPARLQAHILTTIDEESVAEIRVSSRDTDDQFGEVLAIDLVPTETPTGTMPYLFVAWVDTDALFGGNRIPDRLHEKFGPARVASCA